MTKNDEVINYILERINNEFVGDIDMLVCYGSYINGTANKRSDVDMYFIPKNEKGYQLGETFIMDGIGYDIFGMTWERLKEIAEFRQSLSPLVGDVKILYSYSNSEVNKFEQLVQRMDQCLDDTVYMHNCAYDRVKDAVTLYYRMVHASSMSCVRMNAGYILMLLAEAVAYINQTYFHKGLKTQYADLNTFKQLPVNFIELYHGIIKESDFNKIKDNCYEIIKNTITFLALDKKLELLKNKERNSINSNQAVDKSNKKTIDYNNAAGWYEELISTFNKIYECAENENYILAFISASCLQNSLYTECVLCLKTTDLLSEYKYDDLEKIVIRAKEIEQECINQIEQNGVKIRKVRYINELRS